MHTSIELNRPINHALARRLKRLGLSAFLFFSIKGLLWLLLPLWIASRI